MRPVVPFRPSTSQILRNLPVEIRNHLNLHHAHPAQSIRQIHRRLTHPVLTSANHPVPSRSRIIIPILHQQVLTSRQIPYRHPIVKRRPQRQIPVVPVRPPDRQSIARLQSSIRRHLD